MNSLKGATIDSQHLKPLHLKSCTYYIHFILFKLLYIYFLLLLATFYVVHSSLLIF